MRYDRITFVLLATSLAACGANKQDIEAARNSAYDAEFAVVYSAALEATRELYPNLDDRPAPGKIQTAWQEVQHSSCAGGGGADCDDIVNQRVMAQQGVAGSPAAAMAGMPTRLPYKRFFIRFDVHVFGGRPWRVKVTGRASSWAPGAAMPVELSGSERPGWLAGRTQALQLAIYRRIRKYAIRMKDKTAAAEERRQKTDPTTIFKGVPRDAARLLVYLQDALAKRDYAAIKPRLASDVLWSASGDRGADAAMATWLADPIAFDAMALTLAKCSGNFQRVACPAGAVAPGSYQLVLEARPGGWKIASFATAE